MIRDDSQDLDKSQSTTVVNEEDLNHIKSAAQRLTVALEEKEEMIMHLESEVKNLSDKNQQCVDKLRSLYTDFENTKRRQVVEIENLSDSIIKNVFKDLTNLLDNFERCKNLQVKLKNNISKAEGNEEIIKGMENFLKGFDMIYQDLISAMKKYNVEFINVMPGQEFNLELHDAIQTMPSNDYKSGQIAMLVSPGYKIKDSVLRHAKVIVAE